MEYSVGMTLGVGTQYVKYTHKISMHPLTISMLGVSLQWGWRVCSMWDHHHHCMSAWLASCFGRRVLRCDDYHGGQQGQHSLWRCSHHCPWMNCYTTAEVVPMSCHHQANAYKLGLSRWSLSKKTFFLLQMQAKFHLLSSREKGFWCSSILLHLLWKQ